MKSSSPEHPQLTLFQFENVLSVQGLHNVWMSALELSRNPSNVPYGDITAEDIISSAAESFGLNEKIKPKCLKNAVLEEAEGYADYEREQFKRETGQELAP